MKPFLPRIKALHPHPLHMAIGRPISPLFILADIIRAIQHPFGLVLAKSNLPLADPILLPILYSILGPMPSAQPVASVSALFRTILAILFLSLTVTFARPGTALLLE